MADPDLHCGLAQGRPRRPLDYRRGDGRRGLRRRCPHTARADVDLRRRRQHRQPQRPQKSACRKSTCREWRLVPLPAERKSVVEGKRVSERGDLGGRRIMKKKNKKEKNTNGDTN